MDHIETNCAVSKVLVRNYQKGYRVKITGVILNKNAFITRKNNRKCVSLILKIKKKDQCCLLFSKLRKIQGSDP